MKGFIYVLSNPSFSGLLKVGKTTGDAKIRARQLSDTGIPTPFVVELVYPVQDITVSEKDVFTALDSFRINKVKEFFEISVVSAKEIIERTLDTTGAVAPQSILNLSNLGPLAAAKRRKLKLTQPQLASATGVGKSTIDAFENGRLRELGFNKVACILQTLHMPLQLEHGRPTYDELRDE